MSRKSKRTPLEQYWSAEALTKLETDWHNLVRAQTDPCLPFDQRVELLKSLQAWPRIVLCLFQAEHEIALSKPHNDYPSRIAAERVGKVIALGEERVLKLRKQGRRHIAQGMKPYPKITAKHFKKRFSENMLISTNQDK